MDKTHKRKRANKGKVPPAKSGIQIPAEEDDDNQSEHNDDDCDIDDDNDDDDDRILHISPSGSVLTPAQNPYNKIEKIHEANAQLHADKKLLKKPRIPKVHFQEKTSSDEDANVSGGAKKKIWSSGPENKHSKILLVTLPTAYSTESEEIITDDDCEDDLDLINNDFRKVRGFQEGRISKISESEEELEDSALPLTEDILTSSLETVICQSETEESDLTESFTKSINLNIENELINPAITNHSKHLYNNECLEKIDNLDEGVIEIVEKYDLKEEPVISEKCGIRPKTAHRSKMQKSPLFATVNDLSVSKPLSKIRMNNFTKKNSAIDTRPSTAPAKRACCKMGITMRLPAYNGLRSEYGLSKEQLLEREKRKYELSKALKIEKEKNYLEERQKQKDNEIKFKNWLINKKKEAEAKTLRKLRQSNYCFRTTPAPTSHLDRMGVLRRQILKQKNTYLLLDEIFKNARPQEQNTFRIYLGLRV